AEAFALPCIDDRQGDFATPIFRCNHLDRLGDHGHFAANAGKGDKDQFVRTIHARQTVELGRRQLADRAEKSVAASGPGTAANVSLQAVCTLRHDRAPHHRLAARQAQYAKLDVALNAARIAHRTIPDPSAWPLRPQAECAWSFAAATARGATAAAR